VVVREAHHHAVRLAEVVHFPHRATTQTKVNDFCV
jgi:hypothetical protein